MLRVVSLSSSLRKNASARRAVLDKVHAIDCQIRKNRVIFCKLLSKVSAAAVDADQASTDEDSDCFDDV